MDPWPIVIAMLIGDREIPTIEWPTDRRRIVRAADPPEPDLALEPEPPRTAAGDDALLAFLDAAGAVSVRAAADALAMPKSTVARGLQRLRRAGAVRLEIDGWRAC